MKTGTLIKIMSNHNNLRTDTVEGWLFEMPTVGKDFRFYGPSLDPALDQRFIWTTEVESIEIVDEITLFFKTKNSLYKLSNLKEVENEEVRANIN